MDLRVGLIYYGKERFGVRFENGKNDDLTAFIFGMAGGTDHSPIDEEELSGL